MKKALQIAVVLFAFGFSAGLAAQPGNGLKFLLDGGFNNASPVLTYSPTDAQEIELRQHISVDSLGETDSRWRGETRGRYDCYYDAVDFASSKLRPFVGASAGYKYGSSVNGSVMVGPKAGLKIHAQPNTLVLIKAEYQSLYQDSDQVDQLLNNGSFTYSLGIDFHF